MLNSLHEKRRSNKCAVNLVKCNRRLTLASLSGPVTSPHPALTSCFSALVLPNLSSDCRGVDREHGRDKPLKRELRCCIFIHLPCGDVHCLPLPFCSLVFEVKRRPPRTLCCFWFFFFFLPSWFASNQNTPTCKD